MKLEINLSSLAEAFDNPEGVRTFLFVLALVLAFGICTWAIHELKDRGSPAGRLSRGKRFGGV